MVVLKVLFNLTWLHLAFATLKYQGFRKTKIRLYDELKATQNVSTLIECCSFCMATPTCQGVLYGGGKQTCKAIKNIHLDENGQHSGWAIKNLKIQEENDCIAKNWAFPKGDVQGSGITNIEGPKECQVKCQENEDCEIWTYNHENKKCFLKSESVFKNGNWLAIASSGPKYCPTVLDTDNFCFKPHAISGCDTPGTRGSVESGPEGCQKRCQGVSGCHFWVFYKDSSKCYLKKDYTCARYFDNGIAGPKYCD